MSLYSLTLLHFGILSLKALKKWHIDPYRRAKFYTVECMPGHLPVLGFIAIITIAIIIIIIIILLSLLLLLLLLLL